MLIENFEKAPWCNSNIRPNTDSNIRPNTDGNLTCSQHHIITNLTLLGNLTCTQHHVTDFLTSTCDVRKFVTWCNVVKQRQV